MGVLLLANTISSGCELLLVLQRQELNRLALSGRGTST
jgi:hypothetical protein